MDEWLVQQLRISIFPTLNDDFDTKVDLWPYSNNIEQIQQISDPKTGAVINEGFIKRNKLILSITPVKIDLVMIVQAPIRLENGTPVLDTMGTITETLETFNSVVKTWLELEKLPEINRIAFGAQLVKITETREKSYKLLTDYVPYDLNHETMSDFNLQINLLTKSKEMNNLALNRLSKWAAAKIIPEMAIVGNPQSAHKYAPIFFGIVELDINTAQVNKDVLEKGKLFPLYSELVKLGIDLSEKGIKTHEN